MASHSRPLATLSPSPFFSSNSHNDSTEQEQPPHLSAAAYIRSLVKQLRSSSSAARSSSAQHLHAMSSSSTSQDQQQQQQQQGHGVQAAPVLNKPQQVKKQTRRRMHTSRPYQESLLNMAEARREIVTALRIHRANMRQQKSKFHLEQQREQQARLQLQQQPVHQVMMFQKQSQAFEGVPVPMSYANSLSNSSHLLTGAPAGNYYSSSVLSCGLTPVEEEASPAAAIGGQLEQLACGLPAQPLGLNLSFQGFGGYLDHAKVSDYSLNDHLVQSSPCPASPYSSSVTAMAGHGSLALRATGKYSSSADAPAALGQMMDGDGEMLYSIVGDGERQGSMELSETAANVAAASAWWTKILESVESGGSGEGAVVPETQTTEAEAGMADDVAAVWPEWQWLCDGGVGVVEQEVTAAGPGAPELLETHVDDGCYYEGDRGDNSGVALPCIDDIAEVEGWGDEEWFP